MDVFKRLRDSNELIEDGVSEEETAKAAWFDHQVHPIGMRIILV
jgi:hypothetical protein